MLKFETQNVMQLWVPGVPLPQSRPRVDAKGNVYSNASKALRAWKGRVEGHCRAAMRERAVAPLQGALCIDLVFCIPSLDKARHGEVSYTKPDKDNLEKAVLDALESAGLFHTGDSQVGVGQVAKVWSPTKEAGVQVQVKRVRAIKKIPAQGGDGLEWLA